MILKTLKFNTKGQLQINLMDENFLPLSITIPKIPSEIQNLFWEIEGNLEKIYDARKIAITSIQIKRSKEEETFMKYEFEGEMGAYRNNIKTREIEFSEMEEINSPTLQIEDFICKNIQTFLKLEKKQLKLF
jgi:hypothetical protein